MKHRELSFSKSPQQLKQRESFHSRHLGSKDFAGTRVACGVTLKLALNNRATLVGSYLLEGLRHPLGRSPFASLGCAISAPNP